MLTVFGSINLDFSVQVPRLPVLGETLLGEGAAPSPGGKGANQAHAAQRFGVATALVGAVGQDALAEPALAGLRGAGVDVAHVRKVPQAATGWACVAITPQGQNAITVASGANLHLRASDVPDRLLSDRGCLLLQMEVPVAESRELALRARSLGCTVLLNAAPMVQPLHGAQWFDWLVVNEHELAALGQALGLEERVPIDGARHMAAVLGCRLLVTLGAAGAVLAYPSGQMLRRPSPPTDVVDTTGAGDTFTGVFAAALMQGCDDARALEYAVLAGSLACQARGAQPSQPTRAVLDAALLRYLLNGWP